MEKRIIYIFVLILMCFAVPLATSAQDVVGGLRASVCTVTVDNAQNTATISGAGTCTFNVPANALQLTVEVWGGGGGGNSYNPADKEIHPGGDGGTSSFAEVSCAGGTNEGSGGTCSGGQQTTAGEDANDDCNPLFTWLYCFYGQGGAAANGGAGGMWYLATQNINVIHGQEPGGGGAGSEVPYFPFLCTQFSTCYVRGAGAGGYAKRVYDASALPAQVPVTIGAGGYSGQYGGSNQSGHGGDGMVKISWTKTTVNRAPTPPVITGPTDGLPNTSYDYTFKSTDPDGDAIRYDIDWDNTKSTIEQRLPASGNTASGTALAAHSFWASTGTKVFNARTRDVNGTYSAWSTYTVTLSQTVTHCIVTYGDHKATITGPGTCTFTVPNYKTLTATVIGAGGSGGTGARYAQQIRTPQGAAGGRSSFNETLYATGGDGGPCEYPEGAQGEGSVDNGGNCTRNVSAGTGHGGDTNTTGGGALGGAGGCGYPCYDPYLGELRGGTGLKGGKTVKTYAQGALTPGSHIAVGVGAGGASVDFIICDADCGGTGIHSISEAGQNGSVVVTWTDAVINEMPAKPTITGPDVGDAGASLAYTFKAKDPDDDRVRYGIDWNNDSLVDSWTSPWVNSNES